MLGDVESERVHFGLRRLGGDENLSERRYLQGNLERVFGFLSFFPLFDLQATGDHLHSPLYHLWIWGRSQVLGEGYGSAGNERNIRARATSRSERNLGRKLAVGRRGSEVNKPPKLGRVPCCDPRADNDCSIYRPACHPLRELDSCAIRPRPAEFEGPRPGSIFESSS